MLGAGRNKRDWRIARIKGQVEPFRVLLTAVRTCFFGFGDQVRAGINRCQCPMLIASNLPASRANADCRVALVAQVALIDLHDIPTSTLCRSVRHAQLVHPAVDRLARLVEGPLQIGEVIRLAVVVRNVVAQMLTAVVADVVQ